MAAVICGVLLLLRWRGVCLTPMMRVHPLLRQARTVAVHLHALPSAGHHAKHRHKHTAAQAARKRVHPSTPATSPPQLTLLPLAAPAVTAHLAGMHSATKMLAGRITMLVQLLHRIQAGEVEAPHGLLRQLAGLVHSLPALDSSALHADYLRVRRAALLLACCAAVGLVCCLPVRVCASYCQSCQSCTAW